MNELKQGQELFKKEKYKDAIIKLNIFLTSNQNNADALYTRAICYRKIDQFEESINDFTTILTRLPNEPSLLCDRGISHFHNKDIESAMLDMNKAVELDPKNPYRYSSRAYIRSRSDIDGAILDYEKAVELDPKDEIALNNLGLLQENSGRMKAAKQNFNKSNKIIGYDPEKRRIKEDSEKPPKTVKKNNDTLGKIMLSVLTSRDIRKEYFNYISSFFRKNY